MSFIQMSLSGAIMILVIAIVRFFALNRLPKKTFVVLWGIVLLRLFLPFSIPSEFSIYSLFNHHTLIEEERIENDFIQNPTIEHITNVEDSNEIFEKNPIENTPIYDTSQTIIGTLPENTVQDFNIIQVLQNNETILMSIWTIGFGICIIFFVIAYIRCYLEFQTSLPVQNEFVSRWLQEHQCKRKIQIRQYSKISAPLTYGIVKPVILLPKNIDWENQKQLQYILLHEYIHISHFDLVWKLFAILAVCMHWFNPFVWLMFLLFNRDIEFVCDECVIQKLGEDSKANYARTLIYMEEKKSGLTPLCNNFCKSAIEERIGAIMKTKKTTIWMILISILVLIVIAVLFATSGKNNSEGTETENDSSYENETESATEEEEEISTSETGEEALGIVAEDIEVHEAVKVWAVEAVLESFDRENFDKVLYTNWKIDNIVQMGTYTNDAYSADYEIYAIDYKLLSKDTDEWAIVTGENITYLVVDRTNLTNGGSKFGHVLHTVCGPNIEDMIHYIEMHLKSMYGEYEMVFIHDVQDTKIFLDKFEWVTVPSDRATELGFTLNNCPNGYTMYNEETILEKYNVSKDCIYVIQDAMYARINVNQETFKANIEEKYEKYKWRNPYRVIVEDSEIVAIFEQYVP